MRRGKARGLVEGLGVIIVLGWATPAPAPPEVAFDASCDDGPAAWASGFTVVDGLARWFATHESETAKYVIEGRSSTFSHWGSIVEVAPGAGRYEVAVGGKAYSEFRLIEVERSGNRVQWGRSGDLNLSHLSALLAVSDDETPPEQPPPPSDARLSSSLSGTVTRDKLVLFIPDDTPYNNPPTPPVPSIQEQIDGSLEPFLASEFDVIKEYLSTYPAWDAPVQRRDAIKQKISDYATQDGVRYFWLLGDATDWWYLNGPFTAQYWPVEWESIRQSMLALTIDITAGNWPSFEDQIPTFVVPAEDLDPNASMHAPMRPYYFTDQPYADIDDDGIPDVVVTRWPVNGPADLSSAIAKFLAYNDPAKWGTGGPFAWLHLIGDEDWNDVGDGALALDSAGRIAQHVPASVQRYSVLQSVTTSPYDMYQQALGFWNDSGGVYQPLELIVITASKSGKYDPGGYFSKFFIPYSLAFSPNYVTSTDRTVVIAASCLGADFVSTMWWDQYVGHVFGDPVCEAMTTSFVRDAIAWTGPTTGSWQRGNEVIAAAILDKLYETPARRIADSWLLAVQRVYQEHAGDAPVLETLRNYAFLGDPMSRFNPTGHSPVSSEQLTGTISFSLLPSYPNPTGGVSRVRLSLPSTLRVQVAIYDVRGRLVRRLVDETREAGVYTLDWDARDSKAQRVSAGVYFYRCEAGGFVATRKATVLR